ncbi:MAG: hypothetical protein ACK42K_07260 [Leptonema sp. (in: bacteria)]
MTHTAVEIGSWGNQLSKDKECEVQFNEVRYVVQVKENKQKFEKELLKGITGTVKPGKIVMNVSKI